MIRYALGFALLVLGCSSGDDFSVCSVNETQECSCADGSKGAQTCAASGDWGKCQCSDAGGSSGSGGSGGGSSGTGGSSGISGSGGGTDKECNADADCTSTLRPLCIEFHCGCSADKDCPSATPACGKDGACFVPEWVGELDDCTDPKTRCRDGWCDGACVPFVPPGAPCSSDEMCASGHCPPDVPGSSNGSCD